MNIAERRFVPTADYSRWRVTVRDPDNIIFDVDVPHALGQRNAMDLARERVWLDSRVAVLPLAAVEVES